MFIQLISSVCREHEETCDYMMVECPNHAGCPQLLRKVRTIKAHQLLFTLKKYFSFLINMISLKKCMSWLKCKQFQQTWIDKNLTEITFWFNNFERNNCQLTLWGGYLSYQQVNEPLTLISLQNWGQWFIVLIVFIHDL